MTITFGALESFTVSYGDTLKYQKFYKNGKIKVEGIKVKKFRDGLWKYYNKNGKMIKAELYENGFRVSELDMTRVK